MFREIISKYRNYLFQNDEISLVFKSISPILIGILLVTNHSLSIIYKVSKIFTTLLAGFYASRCFS